MKTCSELDEGQASSLASPGSLSPAWASELALLEPVESGHDVEDTKEKKEQEPELELSGSEVRDELLRVMRESDERCWGTDELCERAGHSVSEVSVALLELLLARHIREVGPALYALASVRLESGANSVSGRRSSRRRPAAARPLGRRGRWSQPMSQLGRESWDIAG
jgi:hypothetical protein